MQKKVVGLIYGGKSGEHEVSLKTAFSIINNIDKNQYTILPIYINLQGEWFKGNSISSSLKELSELQLHVHHVEKPNLLDLKQEIDIAFPVIHGPNGEDGTLQGLLELLDIPYVGSGVIGSAVGMDKVMMKTVLSQYGIPQCAYLSFHQKEYKENSNKIKKEVKHLLGFPCFVKPANLGSSVGISKVKNEEELNRAIDLAFEFDHKIIIEEFIQGRELEIGVLGNHDVMTSVVGEIIPSNEFYDYQAKYESGESKTLIPASIPDSTVQRIKTLSLEVFKKLECSGLSRIDFFWNEEKDQLYVNEINTLPGFTPISMYPMLFQAIGISYSALIEKLLSLGFEKHQEKCTKKIMVDAIQ